MHFKNQPLLWLIAAGLSVWRLTSILQQEEVAAPIRKAVGIYEPDGEDPDHWIYPDNFLGKVFYCFWCGSVWVGMGITALMLLFPPLLLPFALSAIAILIKTYIEKEPDTFIENYWAGTSDEGDETVDSSGESDG